MLRFVKHGNCADSDIVKVPKQKGVKVGLSKETIHSIFKIEKNIRNVEKHLLRHYDIMKTLLKSTIETIKQERLEPER